MAEPTYNFTPRAQQVLALARKEADRLNQSFVGTEYLLLGLLTLGAGVAVNVLQKAGLDLDSARKIVEREMGSAPAEKPTGDLPFTSGANKTLALAQQEAKALNHSYLGTEHILLALLQDDDGGADRVFKNANVDVEKCRAEILEQLIPIWPENKAATERYLNANADHFAVGDPPNNFTPRAQQALALARKESDRFHHNYVGTEHLLLGLIGLGQGVGVNVLRKMGLDLETVRLAVEKQVGMGPEQKPTGNIPYTPRVKKVLALAQKEAKALNHSYMGTEHILLGLLREGGGVAGRVLKGLGVDLDRCRVHILIELDPHFSAEKEFSQAMTKLETPSESKISLRPQNPMGEEPTVHKIPFLPGFFSIRLKVSPGEKTAAGVFIKLNALYSGGMPIGDAIRLLSERTSNRQQAELARGIFAEITAGRTLASALRLYPRIFDQAMIGLVEFGETTGNLRPVLENLANQLSDRAKAKRIARQGLACFIGTVVFAAVILLLLYLRSH